jgi:hypothetical protein
MKGPEMAPPTPQRNDGMTAHNVSAAGVAKPGCRTT